MKLTKSDKEILNNWGYPEKDILQIERATRKTIYTLNGKTRISAETAIELIGRTEFLSGIARSAFHWTALRQDKDGDYEVFFDSSAFFR